MNINAEGKVIYITYIKMIQYGCVILDKSFFFADVSSPIDYQYVLPYLSHWMSLKYLKEKSYSLIFSCINCHYHHRIHWWGFTGYEAFINWTARASRLMRQSDLKALPSVDIQRRSLDLPVVKCLCSHNTFPGALCSQLDTLLGISYIWCRYRMST